MHRTITAGIGLALSCLPFQAMAQDYRTASVFGGNEARLMVPYFLNQDCTSGARPDIRISSAPANGAIRLEPIPYVVNRVSTDRLARCNGRRVEGVAIHYKAKEGYAGVDRVAIDVDYRHGNVRQYIVLIDVR